MKKNPISDTRRASASNHRTSVLRCGPLLAVFCMCSLSCYGVIAIGGTSGTGLRSGPITEFGSIFVGGIEWDITGLPIDFDGEEGDEGQLRKGMVVRVQGMLDAASSTGVADSVTFDASTEGVIEADPEDVIAGVTKRIDILGQIVIIDQLKTEFSDGASFDGLVKDDVVEVSGLLDNGVIRATWVGLIGQFVPFATEAELRGLVSNLDANPDGSGLFDIGDVTVRYLAGTRFDDLNASDLVDGLFVEARGVLRTIDELDADRIELETEGLGTEDAEDAEITGFVSGFTALDQPFQVSGVTIDAGMAEVDPPDAVLANGVEVEVKGELVMGVLTADRIEIED